jgi:hypothetical protein
MIQTGTRALIHLPRNPDPGFTPGFDPDSESTSIAASSNKRTEPLDFILLWS